jgi:hypothetical protein
MPHQETEPVPALGIQGREPAPAVPPRLAHTSGPSLATVRSKRALSHTASHRAVPLSGDPARLLGPAEWPSPFNSRLLE